MLPGILSGVAGLLVFLVIHHIWIRPIWFILPLGLLVAGLGGVAAGWSYRELFPHLPAWPWTPLAFMGVIALILAPAIILAEVRAPMYDISVTGGRLNLSVPRAVVLFVLELPLTATVVGAVAGWLIAGTRSAALSTALAGLVFALGPGHNIPLLGGTPGTVKGILLLLAIVTVSAIVLDAAYRLWGR